MVVDIKVSKGKITGVITSMGIEIPAKKVVLTNGTFLNGLIHIGEKQFGGGRAGERASKGLTERLVNLGFTAGRMKTGTPPRVDGRSLDYSKMEEQKGDDNPDKFSFSSTTVPLRKQRSCYITYTNSQVHDALREGFDRSPMFNGAIESSGPRYCPSVEEKINRFADKDRHQIFVEPEGWETVEVYVNGFSTSLPEEIQAKAMRLIPGFENAKIFRPGYAIEYDYFPPTQLEKSLETRLVEGLYFAGQINGTTGYEEAACQGLMAGINAGKAVKGEGVLVLDRSEAYIGVLIDDLISKGTEEPYRMFTSRAEYRILLRQDNADARLTPIGRKEGLINDSTWQEYNDRQEKTHLLKSWIKKHSIEPNEANLILDSKGLAPIKQKLKLEKVLSRPQLGIEDFSNYGPLAEFMVENKILADNIEQAEIAIKYAGYIDKEKENASKLNRLDDLAIPRNFNYSQLVSMSLEAREKLNKRQPRSIKEAKSVSGVSPADLSVLLVYMGR